MVLSFEQVFYRYPLSQKATIQGLSFAIPQGQRTAIIGRNGCGKTTLLRLAQALYRPQSGQIFSQDQPFQYDRKNLNSLRQKIGLVFQDPEQQLVGGTVTEDLSYGLYNLGLPTPIIIQRVKQALRDFDLELLAHTQINYLSLGQKKRLAIADVMILRPELLLLDEPTAYLDPQQTRNLYALLTAIQTAGTTVAIATHDLDFVYRWADWVLVLDQGQLVLEGSPQQLFTIAQQDYLKTLGLGLPTTVETLENLLNLWQISPSAPLFEPGRIRELFWQKLRTSE